MSQIVNRRDLDFLLNEMFNIEETLLQSEYYADYDSAAITAVLDTAESIAEEKFLPVAAKLDENEPTFDGKKVHIIDEVKQALDAYKDAGFFAAGFDYDTGGMQMPWIATQAFNSIFSAANVGIQSYIFLTIGNSNMLNAYGSDELKAKYLPPMLEGRWYGTMCLSETQAGSSLSDIRTKATPTDAGHYLLEGTKMWISGGDQELTENIVHMVLAKIPGSPPGVKGISLFLVPKVRVNDDGSLGEMNNIALAGLNHKMGHRGTTNTLLNFGEAGECHGYLVGEANMGLAHMFHMMNEARIGVGMGATMSALSGYLYSLDYARNRPQGRHPLDKNPESAQVNIIEHADIKRLLMAQKTAVEGAYSLVLYASLLVDQIKTGQIEPERANLLLDLLTPIVKSWPSEFCLEANKHAIQILGGYGYTREYPVERFYRDNRLNHIHEGTHAIHGIDILGRKVRMKNGAAFVILKEEINKTIQQAQQKPALASHAKELTKALEKIEQTILAVTACSDVTLSLANATPFLDALGHVVIAWQWLWQASIADEKLADAAETDKNFYQGKLAACRYFFNYELPKIYITSDLVASLDDTCLSAQAEYFTGV